MIYDASNVLVAFLVRDLVDTKLRDALKRIIEFSGICPYPRHDSANGAPRDPHQLNNR
jgi:hypothetical protein